MSAAFLAALAAYVARDIQPWHTPGHKQGRGAPAALRAILGPALAHDLSDVLEDETCAHSWDTALRRAEEAAAGVFGAAWTRFLVNGASGGIHAAFLGLLAEGDVMIIPRASHLSVAGGLALSGARPVYLPARTHPDLHLPLPPRPADYAAALNSCRARAVFVTSPNYYGLNADVAAIAVIARAHGAALLVDEAHGAHYAFHPAFPRPALAGGADVVVQSAHKTLSALTPAALLHARPGVDTAALERALFILSTSSPSSLVLASLDAARAQMQADGERLWAVALQVAADIREQLNALAGWRCLDQGVLAPLACPWDPCRLVFAHEGFSGLALAALLRRRFGIQVEMADERWVVALCGLGDGPREARRLLAAAAALGGEVPAPQPTVACTELPPPVVVLTPRQAMQRPAERVPWPQAVGRIAAETICPYPPGVPVLAPGEEITAAVAEYLQAAAASGFTLRGAGGDGRVAVVKEGGVRA